MSTASHSEFEIVADASDGNDVDSSSSNDVTSGDVIAAGEASAGDDAETTASVVWANMCEKYVCDVREVYSQFVTKCSGREKQLPFVVNAAAFCESLMAENDRCSELLKRSQQEVESLKEKLSRAESRVESLERDRPESSTQQQHVCKLQARVSKLESQRTEILKVNRQWDSQYHRLKEELQRRRSEQQEEGERERSGEEEETRRRRRRDLHVIVKTAKKEIHTLTNEKAELARNYASAHLKCNRFESEVAEMKRKLDKLETDRSCLSAENLRLNQALEQAVSVRHHAVTSLVVDLPATGGAAEQLMMSGEGESDEDLRTKIEVLQQQVKIYREDWETERREREKMRSERVGVEELLIRSKQETQHLRQQVRSQQLDFKREKRDRERLQRQLQWVQRNPAAASSSSSQQRGYHGNADLGDLGVLRHTDPPNYYALGEHQIPASRGNGVTSPTRPHGTSRPRPSSNQLRLPTTLTENLLANHSPEPADIFAEEAFDTDMILSYPPDDALERHLC